AIAATAAMAGAQGTAKTTKTAAKTTMQATKSTKPHKKVKTVETQATLQKEAKITESAARATALKEVPNGAVKSSELEREKGKLVYSYDMSVPGKPGVEEVNVSAIDGSVVGKMHESAKTEKKEAAKEKTTAKK
ncbi:MAG TPA: PepSY domain-containing protein, partial [Gemmatimonadaceae bacterium]|nr:PepSY domain-containing protein [Gemmatimonadaceae bacterium]